MAWSCIREGSGWCQEKGSSSESGQTLERAPQGSGYGHKLPEFKKHLGSALVHEFWVSCVEPGIELDGLCGTFPTQNILRCMILCYGMGFIWLKCNWARVPFMLSAGLKRTPHSSSHSALGNVEGLLQPAGFQLSVACFFPMMWMPLADRHPEGQEILQMQKAC